MSKYTTQVRWIIEESTKSFPGLPISKRVEKACPLIFNFEYPIWLESYRPILEKKILMRYFNKEIGLETVGLWKFYLEEKLNTIMPYYNKLYGTTVKDYDFMTDINSKETYKGNKASNENVNFKTTGNVVEDSSGRNTMTGSEQFTGTGSNEVNGTNSITKKELKSDLPQANYAGLDYGTDLTDGTQEETVGNKTDIVNDSMTDRESTTNTKNDSNVDSVQEGINKVDLKIDDSFTRDKTGASGTHSLTELLVQYRESLINIDNMVITELQDLFMMIY